MKNKSVKAKITILLTLLMATLALLLLIFMLFISSSVATQTVKQQLTNTVRSNLSYVEVTDHKPNIQDGFSFYHNGISTLIYSQSESLLAGQIPVSFQSEVPFENGMIRIVDADTEEYLVLDLWLASDWNNGVWLRGLVEAPNNEALARNLLLIALFALPMFVLLAGLGSYHITRRTFRPLEHITATSEAINDAKDLSGRINLPPGKDEFSRLAADFDKMFERLERSFEAEKQFTADASHELRTPISIIKGACEYAEKYDETPEYAEKEAPTVPVKATEVPVEELTLKLEETVPSSDAFPAKSDNTAKISEAEAKKIALAPVPGAKESDIRGFEVDYDDGRLEYEGSIYYGELEYEFEIDGYSGAIRNWEVESIYD